MGSEEYNSLSKSVLSFSFVKEKSTSSSPTPKLYHLVLDPPSWSPHCFSGSHTASGSLYCCFLRCDLPPFTSAIAPSNPTAFLTQSFSNQSCSPSTSNFLSQLQLSFQHSLSSYHIVSKLVLHIKVFLRCNESFSKILKFSCYISIFFSGLYFAQFLVGITNWAKF